MPKKKPTAEEKKLLLETIKGDKKKYQIHISGYGGEFVFGTINQEQYEFWKDREDLSDHAYDWDNEIEVPEEAKICQDGNWHEVDNLAHECGCEFTDASYVTVYDEQGNEIWSSALSHEALEQAGVDTDGIAVDEWYLEYDTDAEYVFMGNSFEKGTFYTGEIETLGKFEPRKLSFSYIDLEGISIINGVSYESEIIDDTGGYSTTGKSSDFKVFKVER